LASSSGIFPITIRAANGLPPDAIQVFTLTVANIVMPAVPHDSFTPDSLTAKVGDTIVAANLDTPRHTVTADAGEGLPPAFDTGIISPGTSKLMLLNVPPGIYPFHCTIHSFMHGTLTVIASR
jgi:plastocyanin